jgi:hypothetical protein
LRHDEGRMKRRGANGSEHRDRQHCSRQQAVFCVRHHNAVPVWRGFGGEPRRYARKCLSPSTMATSWP